MTPSALLGLIRRNASVAAALDRLPSLGLPQCYVTAGCLFQTVWNLGVGRPPAADIRDIDVFIFDEDVSWKAEDQAIRRTQELFPDVPLRIELRNQARVHLWYEAKFGSPCPPLRSSRDGIDRFLVACTSIGIEVETGALYAPDGLDDLVGGILRLNPRHPRPAQFRAKAADYQARWPWLTIVDR